MTLSLRPDPANWSEGMKMTTQAIVLATTIIGSAWAGATYIGNEIYNFSETQTKIGLQIEGVREQLREAKSAIAGEDTLRSQALSALKTDLSPRIDVLEKDASATKQRIDDMRDTLNDVKALAQQNLRISTAHDDDIKATRRAVAPKPGDTVPAHGDH